MIKRILITLLTLFGSLTLATAQSGQVKDTTQKQYTQGFCKRADITKVVASRSRHFTRCYEKELMRNPELAGKVTLEWVVDINGRVQKGSARIQASTFRSSAVERCLIRVIYRLKFPKPDGGQCVIRYPFVFNSTM